MYRVRGALITSSVLLTLLKLDFYFVFSFAAQLIPSQKLQYDETITETVLVFVLGALGLTLAILAVYRENMYMMAGFIVAGAGAIAYLIYRLVRICVPREPGTGDPYEFTRRFLIFTVVVAMALILLTMAVAVKSFLNLRKGIYVFAKNTSGNRNKKGGSLRSMSIIDQGSDDFDTSDAPVMEHRRLHDDKIALDDMEEPATANHGRNRRHDDHMWSIE